MKYLVGADIGSYEFNPSNKTIRLEELDDISLEQVLLITNVTTHQIIYQFNKVGFGGSISNNTLTLDFDTTSMSSTDSLQIFIEYKSQTPANSANFISQYEQSDMLDLILQELQEQTRLLKKIYN